MRNHILLIGGMNKAKALAVSLISKGYRVTAVNDSLEDCRKLSEIDRLTVIYGDGSKPYVLQEADAGTCDTAIALTSRDEDNLVICEMCKKKFKVKKTVSLVADPEKTDFFYKMGIDRVVCAISTVTSVIEQQTFVDEISNVVQFGEGRVQIVETRIPEDAPAAGLRLMEIRLPKEVIIGCILRGEQSVIPRGDTQILGGDVLVLISSGLKHIEAVEMLTGRSPDA